MNAKQAAELVEANSLNSIHETIEMLAKRGERYMVIRKENVSSNTMFTLVGEGFGFKEPSQSYYRITW
jgi:hypothetical protein